MVVTKLTALLGNAREGYAREQAAEVASGFYKDERANKRGGAFDWMRSLGMGGKPDSQGNQNVSP